jgi:hypothetical protein
MSIACNGSTVIAIDPAEKDGQDVRVLLESAQKLNRLLGLSIRGVMHDTQLFREEEDLPLLQELAWTCGAFVDAALRESRRPKRRRRGAKGPSVPPSLSVVPGGAD